MSTYRKEKNLVIISLNGASGEYKLDINTGMFYGVKGNPIKTCPRKTEVRNLFPYYGHERGNNLEYLLHQMFDYCANTAQFSRYIEALQSADKIDALGIARLRVSIDQYAYLGKYIKALSTYLKENEFSYYEFRVWNEFEIAKKRLGSAADLLTPEMYLSIKERIEDITTEEIAVCSYYLGRGKMWEYENGRIDKLVRYIDYCRLLEKAPQKVNNFMREFCETRELYNLRKTEFDNKKIVENYAKQNRAWEFSFGDYVVVIPTTGQDIVTEGEQMHHCVGSYVDRVVNNTDYICFIRHKDTPDIPYITCEVRTDGRIGQYFLAYDRYIKSEEDMAFKKAFAEHLAKVWNN